MTAVAGFVHRDGSVWIGADSAGSSDTRLTVRKDPKVFRRGAFLFGFCGSFRQMQLVRFGFTPQERPLDKDVFEYMVTTVVEDLRKLWKDGGTARKREEEEILRPTEDG